MWLVAIAWIYVVGLMAITEHSIVAGIMTFLGYCVLPLSIVWYIAGSKMRRMKIAHKEEQARRARAQRQRAAGQHLDDEPRRHDTSDSGDSGGSDSGSSDSSSDSGGGDSGGSDSSSSSD